MDFYYSPVSPPCRSVLMLMKALNLQPNKIRFQRGDNLKPDFVKINPQHTIPTLVDNGFILWESRAILIYLIQKFGKDDSLYPKDLQKQAIVNQRLYFDGLILATSLSNHYVQVLFYKKPADPENYKKVETAFEMLNSFLEGQKYVAGDNLTIADLSILSTVSSFEICGFEIQKYENVWKWYELCKKTAPGWAENWEGCLAFKKLIQ